MTGRGYMTTEEWLKNRIKHLEAAVAETKKDLEQMFKERSKWNDLDAFEWLKGELREYKNWCEGQLRHAVEEITYLRWGLNPPYCYHKEAET